MKGCIELHKAKYGTGAFRKSLMIFLDHRINAKMNT